MNESIVSHVKEIVERRDESGLTDYLRGEVAQAFVDVVHQVRLHVPSLEAEADNHRPSTFNHPGIEPLQPFTTVT